MIPKRFWVELSITLMRLIGRNLSTQWYSAAQYVPPDRTTVLAWWRDPPNFQVVTYFHPGNWYSLLARDNLPTPTRWQYIQPPQR